MGQPPPSRPLNASTTTTQVYDSTIINKNDLDLTNKSVTNTITNNVISDAKTCSSSMNLGQYIDISGITTTMDVNIGTIEQIQRSSLTFKCVQLSKIQNFLANDIRNSIMNTLNTNFSKRVLDQVEARLPTPPPSPPAIMTSTAETSSTYRFTDTTEVRKKIQNIVETNIQNNLNTSVIQSCISNVNNNQNVSISNITARSLGINVIRQDQAATLLADCLQESNIATRILNGVLNQLGLTVDDRNSVEKITVNEAGIRVPPSAPPPIIVQPQPTSNSPALLIIFLIICLLCISSSVGAYFWWKKQQEGQEPPSTE